MTSMISWRTRTAVLVGVAFLQIGSAIAQDGPRDHPLFSAYPSAQISNFEETEFDTFSFPVGPIGEGDALPLMETIEGSRFSVTYEITNEAVSFTQVYRNYEAAIKASGADVRFNCRDAVECGLRFVAQTYWHGDVNRQGRHNGIPTEDIEPKDGNYAFWSAVAGAPNRPQYFTILVYKSRRSGAKARVVLDVYEPQDLSLGLVASQTASEIDIAISEQGKYEIGGLFFDHDEAVLKPESEEALEAIATFLSDAPRTRFFVVGHTDASGEYDYNLDLSKARAGAVVSELTGRFKISPQQLVAVGVGPVSPVDTNVSDDGRAENRRVELVAIPTTD